MTGITQTIPNYYGGISEQPDYIKSAGQVKEIINGIPDITYGLYKRPGTKRIDTSGLGSNGTAHGALKDVQTSGAWFHYYRDATEGAYVGQVQSDGTVRVWRCSDGRLMTTAWSTDYSGTETNLKAYLATSTPSDLKFLTINDTTFVNNSNASKTVSMLATGSSQTTAKPHLYSAFVELIKTENGRQYAINISDSSSIGTIKTATRITVNSTNRASNGTPSTGHCPAIGTGVYEVDGDGNSGTNLIFRLTVRGQQGPSTSYDTSSDDGAVSHTVSDYGCSYDDDLTLLHGGKGWDTNDLTDSITLSGQTYVIKVTDQEDTKGKTYLGGTENRGAMRPAPTPFDADTAVSATSILGGLKAEIDAITGVTIGCEVIGNGLYIYSDTVNFNINLIENDLMKVIGGTCNDMSELPTQCKHGYIVQVNNTKAQEDNYYLRFEGDGDQDGNGTWVECAKPKIQNKFDQTNMPVTIVRTSATEFTVKRFNWKDRTIGDADVTNPDPSFVGKPINRILFWRNRLAILAGENVICSRPGDFGNFWIHTAVAVSPNDPIDIACSSSFPSDLFDGIELNDGLLVFSTDQQFLLSTTDSITTPETTKLSSVSTYNYNKKVSPISLGKTVAFVDNSGKYSKFFEMANVAAVGQPDVVDQTKLVPRLLANNIDLFTNSRENQIILFGTSSTDTVYGYKYYVVGNTRQQASWFKWKFINPLKYHFVVDDSYYIVDTDNYLQQLNLISSTTDPSLSVDSGDYLVHLDNYVSLSGGTFNSTTNTTAFTAAWVDDITTPNGDLVLVDDDDGVLRRGSFTKPRISGTTITADGDWSSKTVTAGYLYDYQVDFPTIYASKSDGDVTIGDTNASLVIHRVKIGFGRSGLYEAQLTRTGKATYSETYETTSADNYEADDITYLSEQFRTIPVYEKNTNLDFTVKSTDPSPATIRSMSWEGDYSPRFYRKA